MTYKITREKAESMARAASACVAFRAGLWAQKAELDHTNALNLAVKAAERSYQEKLAELAPRIIHDSPWRPIEECPKKIGIWYLLELRKGKYLYPYISGIYRKAHKTGEYFWHMPNVKGFIRKEDISRFMEIPALPDEVV